METETEYQRFFTHLKCTPSLDALPSGCTLPGCTPPRRETVNRQSVRILLECILVRYFFIIFVSFKLKSAHLSFIGRKIYLSDNNPKQSHFKTRMHSSRMRIARSLTVCPGFSSFLGGGGGGGWSAFLRGGGGGGEVCPSCYAGGKKNETLGHAFPFSTAPWKNLIKFCLFPWDPKILTGHKFTMVPKDKFSSLS